MTICNCANEIELNLVIICRQPEGEDQDEEDEDDDFSEIMHRCWLSRKMDMNGLKIKLWN